MKYVHTPNNMHLPLAAATRGTNAVRSDAGMLQVFYSPLAKMSMTKLDAVSFSAYTQTSNLVEFPIVFSYICLCSLY